MRLVHVCKRFFPFVSLVRRSNYNCDIHHGDFCTYPPYLQVHQTKPFYMPFQAMTHKDAPNLLLAGKTMSQTFHANGATRLHPSEWTAGVAAGGAAVLMLQRGWQSTEEAEAHVDELQRFINSTLIGQPLDWATGDEPPLAVGYVCWEQRCFQVDHKPSGQPLYPTD